MTSNPFSEIETLRYEGQTFASVYDLAQWLKAMGDDDAFTEGDRQVFAFVVNQLARLVTK